MHHDPQNTGNYHHPLVTQAGPVPPEEQGCCQRRKEKMLSNKRGYYTITSDYGLAKKILRISLGEARTLLYEV